MASEDQDILAKISQLAGMFATTSNRTHVLNVTFQARSIDTRTIRFQNLQRLMRQLREQTPIQVRTRPLDSNCQTLTQTKIILINAQGGVLEVPIQPEAIEVARQLHLIEIDHWS